MRAFEAKFFHELYEHLRWHVGTRLSASRLRRREAIPAMSPQPGSMSPTVAVPRARWSDETNANYLTAFGARDMCTRTRIEKEFRAEKLPQLSSSDWLVVGDDMRFASCWILRFA